MDILINVVLPLSLAIIMLSLGIGLTLEDFARVLRRPKVFAIGFVCQVILVPLVTLGLVLGFNLPGEIAVGFLLLSFCPGGVTSNIITKFARGDVALSVSLTAVVSVLSVLTVPPLVGWAVASFMKENAPEVSVTTLALAMFLITTVPVAAGVALRHRATALADRIEPVLSKLATMFFVIIVVAAVAGNWAFFVENLATLGPALITLNATLMLLGLLIAAVLRMGWKTRKTISIETGIQNATLGITLSALITGQTDGFSTMALPSAVYGVTMYFVALPFVAWFRGR